jgi:hypothetical protein
MMKSNNKIEYLDHNFISDYHIPEHYKWHFSGTYICSNCKLYVCMAVNNLYITNCSYLFDKIKHDWRELNITCDEVIIKNILE